MPPKDADRMADNVDPDETACQWGVWSGSTLCLDLSVWKLKIIMVNPTFCDIGQSYIADPDQTAPEGSLIRFTLLAIPPASFGYHSDPKFSDR